MQTMQAHCFLDLPNDRDNAETVSPLTALSKIDLSTSVNGDWLYSSKSGCLPVNTD